MIVIDASVVLPVAHLIAMVFATFRLTELFLMDKITEPLRRRLPHYLWSCLRCVSVWAGAAAIGIYLIFPWINWPLTLSWFYIAEIDWRQVRQLVRTAKVLGG